MPFTDATACSVLDGLGACSDITLASPHSAVGSVSRLAFRSSHVRFLGPAPFTSCQLKGGTVAQW